MHPAATIIIPQYEQPELTCACIRSLRTQDSIRWPILVVDDGSSSAARDLVLAANFEQVRLLHQEHSGITAAWNLGIQHAKTSAIVFLNNDVLFHGRVISKLLAGLETSLVAGVRMRTERAVPAGVRTRLPTTRLLEGWCFAVDRLLLEQLGGFDPHLKLYFSDTDFQVRAINAFPHHAEPLACLQGLPLQHLGHRSTRQLRTRSKQWKDDQQTFCEKWGRS